MGEQTLRPITIKQLKNVVIQPDGTFKIDGVDVTQVTFVGVIRGVNELATNVSYQIEDGTDTVEVRRWVDHTETASDAQQRRELSELTYVRVYGRLNQFNNKVNCVAFAMRPITDFNELTYHLLDTIYTHVSFTKSSNDVDNKMDIDSGSFAANTRGTGRSVNDQVMDALKQYHDREEGAHIDQIIRQLRGTASEGQVRDAIEYLTNEGHCFTTIDDFHIKSTESY
ncbi:hypothetical protein BX666DRAFT_1940160 [Dichotomocladium elegans]|nr:hypothetical protein BX666DRAFT_1940160 [Dichotomocladium elegans]